MWTEKEIIIFYGVLILILLFFIVGIVLFLVRFRNRKIEYQQEMTHLKANFEKEKLQVELNSHKYAMSEIGKEIHDGVGQKLTLASIYLKKYSVKASDSNLTEVYQLVDESLQELRGLSRSLVNPEKYILSLKDLLLKETKKIDHLYGISTHIYQEGKGKLPQHYRHHLLRIVQEFLQNSIKHSKCKEINIYLNFSKENFHISCIDNGIGFNPKQEENPGVGLLNIGQRVSDMNGEYKITSGKGEGTTLLIIVPYPDLS